MRFQSVFLDIDLNLLFYLKYSSAKYLKIFELEIQIHNC